MRCEFRIGAETTIKADWNLRPGKNFLANFSLIHDGVGTSSQFGTVFHFAFGL